MATITPTTSPSASSPLCAVNSSNAQCMSTQPACTSNDPSTRTAVLSSTGPAGGIPGLCKPPVPTPIVNQFKQMGQIDAQNRGGMASGGAVQRFGCGGVASGSKNCIPTTPTNATPTTGTTAAPNTTTTPTSSSLSCGIPKTCPVTTPPASTPTTTPAQPPVSCGITSAGVPTGAQTSTANANILAQQQQNASNPTLTCSETQKATQIQNSQCQMLCPNKYNVSSTGLTVTPTTGGNAAQACAPAPITVATYGASQVQSPQMTAATANACPNAIVSNQIQQLTSGLAPGNTPAWAQPSVNWANAIMGGRGLGASSIASQALVTAVQQAALPVAQANANYFAQLQAANLTNEQQAAVVNQQSAVQTLLSNQSAVNAAMQFNATNENQVAEFMSNLASQINLSNAAQANAMAQFNAGQMNAVAEYNGNLQNQINQFNAQNQLTVDQSNVTWRRNINTLNTAATNAANQTNVQNMFNMSQTAQTNLWNQFQDAASWANTDAQNALTRAQNLAIAAMGQSTAFKLNTLAGQQAFEQLLGKTGLNILTNSLNNSGSGSGSGGTLNNSGSTNCYTIECGVKTCAIACNPQVECGNSLNICP